MSSSIQNLDLLSVGIAVAATIVLGFTVYITNRKSETNKTFLAFSVITALWGIVNYFSYQSSDSTVVLWLLRLVLFFASFQAYFLYRLFLVFPEANFTFSKKHNSILVPLVCIAALSAISPFGFEKIDGTAFAQQVALVTTGPALGIFSLISVGFVIGALYQLVKKIRNTKGSMRHAMYILLVGIALMFLLIISFNLIIATVFSNPRYVPLGALFTFPFVAAASYAILREHLFNIKVLGAAVLVFLLSISSFAEIIFSNSLILILFRSGVFLLVLVFGVNLIQSVLREVEQREKIQQLADQLELANEQQVTLIHFITHQIKGFLTKSRNVFSMALEGDFGPVPDALKPMLQTGFDSDTQGVQTVQEILNASNIRSGKVTYNMQPFDFAALVKELVAALKPNADAKNVVLNLLVSENPYTIIGDRMQLENAIKNIIDNAIKYTPTGEINISLSKEGEMVKFVEQDTGVGITPEDMTKLFTEGGHGKESLKVNVESTGFGLYIVKNIITAHGGKIWAESEGAGKGSKFIIELPVGQPAPEASVSK